MRMLAPVARASGTGHHGGTSWSSATSHSKPASIAAKSGSRECGVSGTERPWKRFQVSTRVAIARRSVPRLPRHLLTGAELTRDDLAALLHRASELKDSPRASRALQDRIVALVFEKPSTRTRVSFEAGIVELAGHPMILRGDEMQLSRGESVKDTARILSAHVDAVGVRTGPDAVLEELAAEGTIPVFNMLTAGHHPCQALADLMTLRETFGDLDGLKLAYVGDGNNVARSLAILGRIAGVEVVVASPDGYGLEPVAAATLVTDPVEAVAGARAVYADVWVSMGDEATAEERRAALGPYRIDDALLDRAAPDAVALHCLPAHPGEEITAEVLYGPRQRIWQQAENRRHAQKALLEWLVR
jgi:ornithine carbamoyltransferase